MNSGVIIHKSSQFSSQLFLVTHISVVVHDSSISLEDMLIFPILLIPLHQDWNNLVRVIQKVTPHQFCSFPFIFLSIKHMPFQNTKNCLPGTLSFHRTLTIQETPLCFHDRQRHTFPRTHIPPRIIDSRPFPPISIPMYQIGLFMCKDKIHYSTNFWFFLMEIIENNHPPLIPIIEYINRSRRTDFQSGYPSLLSDSFPRLRLHLHERKKTSVASLSAILIGEQPGSSLFFSMHVLKYHY